ncbi:RidA family protein [Youxingia wuxianensis]|uniref:RidA family protein n=1 Tax=Youxingia wuxianensis TaxID=2763678 RepID=A0A926ELE9_9FIRM|nr:RidA family protein [Youxingia wuxianensis]MBC8584756.1 RidA family protein [Youxingia wuxianensis]
MDIYERLRQLDLKLPSPIPAQGIYTPIMEFRDNLLYGSGMGPNNEGLPRYEGKLGQEFNIEQGQEISRQVILNILANIHRDIGDLNKIKRFVKMLAFVNSTDDFCDQPAVANGASSLLCEIFGEEAGLPARSAIGVNVLPGNIPVEIELIAELKEE